MIKNSLFSFGGGVQRKIEIKDTIYFIILNALILEKILLLLYRNEVYFTANRMRIIYAHVTIRCVTRCQVCC